MNWEAIGSVGEIFGALAVVLSLLFVGRQFRHSSTYSLESIYHQTVANFSSSPENASVIARGNTDYENLTETEQQHYVMMLHNLFSALEAIYSQHRKRLIHEESLLRVFQVAYFYFEQPGFRIVWDNMLRSYFMSDFVEAVESRSLMQASAMRDVTLGTRDDA